MTDAEQWVTPPSLLGILHATSWLRFQDLLTSAETMEDESWISVYREAMINPVFITLPMLQEWPAVSMRASVE